MAGWWPVALAGCGLGMRAAGGVRWRCGRGRGGAAVADSRHAAWIGDTKGLGAPAGSQGGIGSREESEEWRTEEIRVVIGLGCRVGFVGCAVRTA